MSDNCRGIGLDHRWAENEHGRAYCHKCGVAKDPDAVRRDFLGEAAFPAQPPALGGEPDVIGKLVRQRDGGYDCFHPGANNGKAVVLLDDHRARVAPLLAKIDQLKLQLETMTADRDAEKSMKATARMQRDTLNAQLDQLRTIAEERKQGYANREHGAVLNGRCMDNVCALFDAAPAANPCAFPGYPPVPEDRKLPAAKDGAPSTYVVENHMDDPKPMQDGAQ